MTRTRPMQGFTLLEVAAALALTGVLVFISSDALYRQFGFSRQYDQWMNALIHKQTLSRKLRYDLSTAQSITWDSGTGGFHCKQPDLSVIDYQYDAHTQTLTRLKNGVLQDTFENIDPFTVSALDDTGAEVVETAALMTRIVDVRWGYRWSDHQLMAHVVVWLKNYALVAA